MKKKLIQIPFIMLLMITTALAAGQNTVPDEKGIDQKIGTMASIADVLELAWARNPRIAAARQAWRQAIEKHRVDTAYPDPQLAVTYFPKPIETRLGPQDWNLNFNQTVPFPGKLSRKGDIASSRSRVAELNLDKTVKEVHTDIIVSYQELYYIRKAIDAARSNHRLAGRLLEIGENSYADDQANFYDMSKARAQIAQVEYDILLLEELEDTEKIKLNSLLNREPDAPLGDVAALKQRETAYSLKELLSFYQNHHEDMQIAEERIEQADAALKISKLERLPDFRFGLFYAGIGNPGVERPPVDAGDDAVGIQFGINIPIWSGKNNGRIQGAVAGKRKVILEKDSIRNKARTEISRIWFKMKNAQRLIELYETSLLPQAVNSLQTAETWYREGRGSFSDFLEIQATVYNYQVSLERARADYNQMFARLERLAGVALDGRTENKMKGQPS